MRKIMIQIIFGRTMRVGRIRTDEDENDENENGQDTNW